MINFSVPQIPILSMSDDYSFNMTSFMFLGSSNAYGNLMMKNIDYAQRHHYINELLREIYYGHTLETEKRKERHYTNDKLFYKVKNHTETVIYWLRKTADDYIALAYLTYYLHIKKDFVVKFHIDCIGALLSVNKKDEATRQILIEAFGKHTEPLRRLNEVSNSYKHSFANHGTIHHFGKFEPTVIEINTNKNNFGEEIEYNSYTLRDIIEDYIKFIIDAETQIKKWVDNWKEENTQKSSINPDNC